MKSGKKAFSSQNKQNRIDKIYKLKSGKKAFSSQNKQNRIDKIYKLKSSKKAFLNPNKQNRIDKIDKIGKLKLNKIYVKQNLSRDLGDKNRKYLENYKNRFILFLVEYFDEKICKI